MPTARAYIIVFFPRSPFSASFLTASLSLASSALEFAMAAPTSHVISRPGQSLLPHQDSVEVDASPTDRYDMHGRSSCPSAFGLPASPADAGRWRLHSASPSVGSDRQQDVATPDILATIYRLAGRSRHARCLAPRRFACQIDEDCQESRESSHSLYEFQRRNSGSVRLPVAATRVIGARL